MDWKEIKNESEIDQLQKLFGYFHDSCLKELSMSTESYVNEDLSMSVPDHPHIKVRMLFQRQFSNPSAIELLFEGVTKLCISSNPKMSEDIIYDAKLLYKQGQYYWINTCDWEPGENHRDDVSWISAGGVKWRDVSQWMGNKQRYGEMDS